MIQARLEFVVVLLCTLVVTVGCGREKNLECDGGSSETKIVNNRTSSEEGVLLLEFSDGQNVPSEMEMSGDTGCNIRLEPLFEGVEDKNLERWYVARFSSEISSERVAAELAGVTISPRYNTTKSSGRHRAKFRPVSRKMFL